MKLSKLNKLISAILVVAMLLSFAACDKTDSNEQAAEKIERIYLKAANGEEISADSTIILRGTEVEKQFIVMADGHQFRDFELSVEDEGVLDIKNNGAGLLTIKLLKLSDARVTLTSKDVSASFIFASDVIQEQKNSDGGTKVESGIKLLRDYNAEKKENLKGMFPNDPRFDIYIKTLTNAQLDSSIATCNFAAALGNRTLDAQEIRELSVKAPSEIASKVKTVADAFAYLKTVSLRNHGDVYTSWYPSSNGKWGADHPGEIEIYDNDYVCCGGMANIVAYLLAGDYDEVGSIQWIGECNHVINYIKQGEKYYIIDFTQLCWNGNWPGCDINSPVIDNLEDFGDALVNYKDFFFNEYDQNTGRLLIYTVLARTLDERGSCPIKWNNQKGTFTVPKEDNGDARIIYSDPTINADPTKCLKYESLTGEIPGWNADYTNLKYSN